MPLCFIEPQEAIRVVAESVGREARRQLLGEVVRAWVDEIPDDELEVHYAKAVDDLDDEDLSMLAAWHASLNVGHPVANKEFLLGAFGSLGEHRREALRIAAGFRGDEAFEAGASEEHALETVLPWLSEDRAMELAAEALELYCWDRLGSDTSSTSSLRGVGAEGADAYLAGTKARWRVLRRPGQAAVELPGIYGLLPCAGNPRARLLVTDDRAREPLEAVLPDLHAGAIDVFDTATRCAGLIGDRPGWRVSERSTAMVCRDLRSVPAAELPSELRLRRVRRRSGAPPEGVPFEHALAAVLLADPRIEDPDLVADFLDSLPPETHLFAAVDRDGVVRATSGSAAFGSEARVFFVNTVPGWRGRGIGQTMTAAALHAAAEHGAERVSLNATGAGLGIYRRLGFEAVGQTTRFMAPLPAPTS